MFPYLTVSFKEFKNVVLFKLHPLQYVRALIWYVVLFMVGIVLFRYCSGFIERLTGENVYAYWVYYSIVVGIYFMNTLTIALFSNVDRKVVERDEKFIGEIAVLIACHNSEEVLVHTIGNLVHTFLPEQIYVADNNNSPEPINTKTLDLCERTGVNYHYHPIGNKGNALNKTLDVIDSKYEYILTLDDDTLIPEDFSPDKSFFDDERVSSIGFGIKIKEKLTLSEKMADFEYKLNSIRGYVKNDTTDSFIVGIAGLWRRKIFHKIISMNPTAVKATFLGKHLGVYEAPHGEDSYNGVISRMMGYKQHVDIHNFVETYAPPRFFHNTGDLLCTTKNISGYNSLNHYSQRALRWYRSQLARIPYELYLLCTYNASSKDEIFLVKVLKQIKYRYNVLWKHLLLYFSFSLILTTYVVISSGFYMEWIYVHVGIYVFGILSNVIMNYVVFRNRQDLQVEPIVVLLYPFFTTYVTICRFMGMLGAFTFHIPFRTPFFFSFVYRLRETRRVATVGPAIKTAAESTGAGDLEVV